MRYLEEFARRGLTAPNFVADDDEQLPEPVSEEQRSRKLHGHVPKQFDVPEEVREVGPTDAKASQEKIYACRVCHKLSHVSCLCLCATCLCGV